MLTRLMVQARESPLRYRLAGPYVRPGAATQPLYLLVVKGIAQASGRQHRRRKPSALLVVLLLAPKEPTTRGAAWC